MPHAVHPSHPADPLARPLAALVARHAPLAGTYETPIEGLRLFRVSSPVPRLPGVYDPSVCVVVSGTKFAFHDGRTVSYGVGTYLCTTMPTPLEAEVPAATPEEPVLGVLVDLGTRPAAELVIQHRAAAPVPAEASPAGLVAAAWDEPFTTALLRLLQLLDDGPARTILADGRLRELLYTLITGPAGPAIRNTLGATDHQLAQVLMHMRDHLAQPLAVQDLADRAGMSRASFDRHFRSSTGLSPLRYLKALRLNDAAMSIAAGSSVNEAATRVGYASASQFSREFRRHFGRTPRSFAATAGAPELRGLHRPIHR